MSCASPCNGVCQLDCADLCLGCLRTGGEIAAWSEMGEREKYFVLTAVRERRSASSPVNQHELTAIA